MSPPLASPATTSTASALGTSVLALIAVIALILLLAWLLRRLPGLGARGHGGLSIVASLPVGMKERVIVVAAGEEQFLLGITSEHITLLHRLPTPLPPDPQKLQFAGVLERVKRGGRPP